MRSSPAPPGSPLTAVGSALLAEDLAAESCSDLMSHPLQSLINKLLSVHLVVVGRCGRPTPELNASPSATASGTDPVDTRWPPWTWRSGLMNGTH